jgi:hypothetical protein
MKGFDAIVIILAMLLIAFCALKNTDFSHYNNYDKPHEVVCEKIFNHFSLGEYRTAKIFRDACYDDKLPDRVYLDLIKLGVLKVEDFK